MITKLNSYILTDRVKDAMRNKLYKTQQEELGFTLCSKSDNIIMPGRDLIGDSRKIEIDPGACKEDEKFLGGYHTHHETDSRASAEDLYHCGKFKIICTGGKTDNKIRCHTWKYEQLSSEDIGKMTDIVKKGVTNFESLKYQQSFNCFDTMEPLYSREKNVKENMDKKIYDIKSFLSILKKSGATESATRVQNMLTIATKARNIYANKLVEEIKNESKKYYNEVEIK